MIGKFVVLNILSEMSIDELQETARVVDYYSKIRAEKLLEETYDLEDIYDATQSQMES